MTELEKRLRELCGLHASATIGPGSPLAVRLEELREAARIGAEAERDRVLSLLKYLADQVRQ